jgi:transposase
VAALPAEDLDRFHTRYRAIVDLGYVENPRPAPTAGPARLGRRAQSKARNLLDRFRDHPDGILAFVRDFAVPFTNNGSERDLRMMKLREKTSGSFRSVAALVDFCRIRGYVSTARKNGLSAPDALRRAFAGDPFIPTPPTAEPARTE